MSDVDTEVDDRTDVTRREGPGAPRLKLPRLLERGTLIGRYVLMSLIGEGGMGVVYSAFDPELDRKVAIKLLQARAAPGLTGDQAWLLREAQAMARLSHPNVIAVHDVGTVPGDRVFVAMEYVDGMTLRAWLKAEVRPWRDVLRVMLAAGAGLAAAHASGLVHRDFKPDNVLVGNDGRVRVMDFGLARLRADDGEPHDVSDLHIEASSPLSASLTVVGTLVGTPAYMAPELQTGVTADARSDQFSFGVALYEALYRVRPFDKDTPTGARARQPSDTRVPARIQRVVMRAISPDREERFHSIDELLAELAVDVSARRRRALIVAGVLSSVGIAAGAGFALSRTRETPCTGIEQRLAGAWDGTTKAAVHKAFVATKLPYAGKAYDDVAAGLDRYARSWTDAAVDSCSATRIRGDQTEELLTLREICLDRRLAELRSLAELLADADADLVEKADRMMSGLERVTSCANVAALRASGRPPTEPRAKVEAVNKALADSKAQLLAGRYIMAIVSAKQVVKLGDELHYPPYNAEALLVQGASYAGAGNSDEAATACTDGVWQAVQGHRDDLSAGAAMCAAAAAAQHRIGEANIWMGLARAMVTRVGVEPDLELRLLEVQSLVAAASGDAAAALETQQTALAAAERAYGANSPLLWTDEEVIGVTLAKTGAYDKAMPHLERAMTLHEITVGPDHPDIAVILTTLGACYSHAGAADKARATYERAIAIKEHTEGKDSAGLVLTLNNMADGMTKAGDTASALFYLDRAKVLADKAYGPANPMTHALATTRGEALSAAGRVAEARAVFDDTLAVETKYSSPFLAGTLTSRAVMELSAKQFKAAAAFGQRAVTAVEAMGGKDVPDLFQPLTGLARAQLGLGHTAEARATLERALVIGEKAQLGDSDLEPVRKLRRDLEP